MACGWPTEIHWPYDEGHRGAVLGKPGIGPLIGGIVRSMELELSLAVFAGCTTSRVTSGVQ
eukprot:2208051-Amphidinium_carterae.1